MLVTEYSAERDVNNVIQQCYQHDDIYKDFIR